MTIAIAFDIYGTLINPHGVVDELSRHLGEDARRHFPMCGVTSSLNTVSGAA